MHNSIVLLLISICYILSLFGVIFSRTVVLLKIIISVSTFMILLSRLPDYLVQLTLHKEETNLEVGEPIHRYQNKKPHVNARQNQKTFNLSQVTNKQKIN